MRPHIIAPMTLSLCLLAPSASAGGWRYPNEIPGLGNIMLDPVSRPGRVANNFRARVGTDYASGKLAKVGGTATSYQGTNHPIVGDFNGDGRDDIGVRWRGGAHNGKWTISLNDGKGGFLPGKRAKVGGSSVAYLGPNQAFTGDFNNDGFDDIGVHWTAGPHAGKWTISTNDKLGNFGAGKVVKVGGAARSYTGDNEVVVGDFDGDGFDDLGVRWKSGTHAGRWTFSRNTHAGSFAAGTGASFGGLTRAYKGANRPLVADVNGDGFDDILVRWTGGANNGRWTVSINDADGGRRFAPGRAVTFAGAADPQRAYRGANVAFAGDFGGDGFADVGVHWTGGAPAGKWVLSKNVRRASIGDRRRMAVRVPMVFVNFKGGQQTTHGQASALVEEVRDFFERTSHGNLDLQLRFKIVNLDHGAKWAAGIPAPKYHASTGALLQPGTYPSVSTYKGYECRFDHPKTGGRQIIFKNANGNLDWTNNTNIHRNYCQAAERNYAGDAMKQLAAQDPSGFGGFLDWANAGTRPPTVAYVAPEFVGGGNRTFTVSWGGAAKPVVLAGSLSFRDYLYSGRGPKILAHELGHLLGHDSELYAAAEGTRCGSDNAGGFLGPYDVMGEQWTHFAALSAVNRWRFGFTQAKYLTPADKTTKVTLPTAMSAGANRSVAVIQPDPVRHPDEVFLVENRAGVTMNGKTFDAVSPAGIFIYHVNSKGPTKNNPLVELVNQPAVCPSQLLPHQNNFTPSTVPAAKFHDGTNAKFSISGISKSGSNLSFTVSFSA